MSEEFRIMNESFKSWFYEHGEDWNSSSIKPVWEAAWKSRIPEGYALVPVEPTLDIVRAGYQAEAKPAADMEDIYKAMIKAAQESK